MQNSQDLGARIAESTLTRQPAQAEKQQLADVFSDQRRHNTKKNNQKEKELSVCVRERERIKKGLTVSLRAKAKFTLSEGRTPQDRDHGQSCTNELQGAPQQGDVQSSVPSKQQAPLSSFTSLLV